MNQRIALDELEAPVRDVFVAAREGGPLARFFGEFARAQRLSVTLTHDTRSAMAALEHASPMLALIELTLPADTVSTTSGLTLCQHIRRMAPEVWLILVTPPDAADARVQAFELGVQDCISDSFDARELDALIGSRFTAIGRSSGRYRVDGNVRPLQAESIDRRASELTAPYGLSPRETQVLALIARGIHPKEVADRLGCGYTSVRTHLRRLSKKLGCAGTREIVVRFFYGDFEP